MVYLKYLKFGIIAIILVAAFILMPLFYNKWRDAEAKTDQVAEYATSRDREITYYQNELQREVAKGNALVMDRKAFLELKENFQYLTEEFKGVKKNLKNVEQITRVTANVIDTLSLPVRDSSIVINNTNYLAKKFEYMDEFNKLNGLLIGDSVEVNFAVDVPLEMIVTWQRSKILGLKIGRKKYHVEGTSKNKSVKITSLENIKIQKN